MTLLLEKIISGGQTGADQGALSAALDLGLATGGWIPRGFVTDNGRDEYVAKLYGLIEHSSPFYTRRTWNNVVMSDATLIFGNPLSPGCKLTKRYADRNARPTYTVLWIGGHYTSLMSRPPDQGLLDFLDRWKVKTLNAAGNRERTNPGIRDAVRAYLKGTLEHYLEKRNVG